MRIINLLIGGFLLFSTHCYSQAEGDQKVEILFSPGLSFQSFTDIFFINRDYEHVWTSIGLDGESNAQGFGLPLPIHCYFPLRNLGVRYEPVLRYDVVVPKNPYRSVTDPQTKDKFGFFADHHLTVYRKFGFSKGSSKSHIMGLGYSLISPGLSYNRDWIITNFTHGTVMTGNKVDLSFGGGHIFFSSKIYRDLYANGRLIYIPKNNIIYNYSLASMMFSITLEYKFRILHQERVTNKAALPQQ
jgi:hypothetical protein